jgi:hypothetical protein
MYDLHMTDSGVEIVTDFDLAATPSHSSAKGHASHGHSQGQTQGQTQELNKMQSNNDEEEVLKDLMRDCIFALRVADPNDVKASPPKDSDFLSSEDFGSELQEMVSGFQMRMDTGKDVANPNHSTLPDRLTSPDLSPPDQSPFRPPVIPLDLNLLEDADKTVQFIQKQFENGRKNKIENKTETNVSNSDNIRTCKVQSGYENFPSSNFEELFKTGRTGRKDSNSDNSKTFKEQSGPKNFHSIDELLESHKGPIDITELLTRRRVDGDGDQAGKAGPRGIEVDGVRRGLLSQKDNIFHFPTFEERIGKKSEDRGRGQNRRLGDEEVAVDTLKNYDHRLERIEEKLSRFIKPKDVSDCLKRLDERISRIEDLVDTICKEKDS